MTIAGAGGTAVDGVEMLFGVVHRRLAFGEIPQRLALVLVGQELAFLGMNDMGAVIARLGVDVVMYRLSFRSVTATNA